MTLPLSLALKIRSMVYIAGEAIPNFWPMRSFIHHNPLHGLEHLSFDQAVARGEKLFHARGFLSRAEYQRYLANGGVDPEKFAAQIDAFCARQQSPAHIDLRSLLLHLSTRVRTPVIHGNKLATTRSIAHYLLGKPSEMSDQDKEQALRELLHHKLNATRPVYDSIDALLATDIGATLDDLLIKSCLDFFDEGQSAWGMPNREEGLYRAWRQLALHNLRFKLRGLNMARLITRAHQPETMIALVMEELKIPEQHWVDYFTCELTRLHGWAGFVRWRAHTKHYHWQQVHPSDLVDLLALRLCLSLALLQEQEKSLPWGTIDAPALHAYIERDSKRAFLQHELHTGEVLPAFALEIEETLACGSPQAITGLCARYVDALHDREISQQTIRLRELAQGAGISITELPVDQIETLITTLSEFERVEGMLWLRAMEATAMQSLVTKLSRPPETTNKRPFAQALFCIDTRSEPIRRQLESFGDYQTYGIAGFFGVPMSFIELGKGSEAHLCPAVVTPRNLTLEMSIDQINNGHAIGALEHALHELKESIVAPFATVEAVGLLFGFDMFGKTLAPTLYNHWRERLLPQKPSTRLLLDKLSSEQADSIVRAVQRALIVVALKQELGLKDEGIPDDITRELREAALDHQAPDSNLQTRLDISEQQLDNLLQRLRKHYRINRDEASRQMEQLSRIGFSQREQIRFVTQALSSIGLVNKFSRFVLLIGHGSQSQNNPYESALDCGACGGNNGINNARALAHMANKPDLRHHLREQGIDIPDDTWFIPAIHNTTTDEIELHDLELLPAGHLLYLDRLRKGLRAASRLSAQERTSTLVSTSSPLDADRAKRVAHRNAMDWSQVRPEWGLSRNAYFIIGRRTLTQNMTLQGRAFLHSYDWRFDARRRLLENILTGPLVVGQWINMEHYFSAVDNERYGSGSKAYHNVAGRFAVMSGNIGDLRTGLPAQTVLKEGHPYHDPIRLICVIEAPFQHARDALAAVASVKSLVQNGWIRLVIVDPETGDQHLFDDEQREWTPYTAFQPASLNPLENEAP